MVIRGQAKGYFWAILGNPLFLVICFFVICLHQPVSVHVLNRNCYLLMDLETFPSKTLSLQGLRLGIPQGTDQKQIGLQ